MPVGNLQNDRSQRAALESLLDGTSSSLAAKQDAIIAASRLGTGSVARTVEDVLGDNLTVKSFGAVGDGQSRPLSGIFASFAAAQAAYPTALAEDSEGTWGDAELDWAAIQELVGSGRPAKLPLGTYLINRPIDPIAGGYLIGDGPTNTAANKSSKIRLKDGSNCSMVRTPAGEFIQVNGTLTGVSAYRTHYVGIRNILLDCNGAGQTSEHIAVDWRGVFVHSPISDLFIYKSFGPAIQFGAGGVDFNIQRLWIQSCCTSTYAIQFNETETTAAGGVPVFGEVFLENISIPNSGAWRDPLDADSLINVRTSPTYRGKGVNFYNVGPVTVQSLHIEAAAICVDIDNAEVNCLRYSFAHVGSATQSLIAGWRILSQGYTCLDLGYGFFSDGDTGFKLVARGPSLSSDTSLRETGTSETQLVCYRYANSRTERSPGFLSGLMYRFLNYLRISPANGYSPSALFLDWSDSDATLYSYLKASSTGIKWGTRVNQASDKDFAELYSPSSGSGNGDRFRIFTAIELPLRNTTSNLIDGMFTLMGATVAAAWPQVRLGSAQKTMALYVEATATNLASAANAVNTTGKVEKLMAYDTTNKRWYAALGSATTDKWRPIGALDDTNSITPA